MMRRALAPLTLAVALLFSTCATATAAADDAGVTAETTPATTPEAGSAALAPSSKVEAVTNPVKAPVAAWDDVKAARKTSWPLAIWLGLVMLGKALAYGRDKLAKLPLIGKLAAMLAKGKGAMIVAAIGAMGAVGYEALLNGGSWVAALVASGAALGGVISSTTKTTGGTAPVSSSPS